MKQITANFKFAHTYRGYKCDVTREVYGMVTFQDGKLSISIPERKYLSGVHKIEERVREEFKDYKNSPIFSHIVETSDTLVDELREATQDLKKDYIEKTKASAKRMYDYAVENYPAVEKKSREASKEYGASMGWGAREKWNTLRKEADRLKAISSRTFEAYLKSELDYAEIHYESSLVKLATRLVQKGISTDYKITSGYVGVNFEVNITHANGKVKAWTIIAEGAIVRAHYRYLVK